jgi:hypothetical protein
MPMNRQLNWALRQKRGYQLAEFTAAFTLLIIGIAIPLLDLGMMPINWLLSQEILTTETRRLAQSNTFKNALQSLEDNGALSSRIEHMGGVKLISIEGKLFISMLNEPYETCTVDTPGKVPPQWLPNGTKGPCDYDLDVTSTLQLTPLVILSGFSAEVPGLTRPFRCVVKSRAHWENTGRDPITKNFYLNE